MADIIASTYEIKEVIGAGGGGTVFLARHLRLDKDVVLKADKRKITTREDLLRREVNVLKDLRHPYIPQVYDFFVEDDTVYTVIDFVQGESLDKPLKRGEKFSQPQVIRWGRQLLDALQYLHSPTHGDPPRGYVHSDIKPANLMRRPNGDICLIDFNIALAIGEENVVGLSAGYASPEHYGLDYSSVGSATAAISGIRRRSRGETAQTASDQTFGEGNSAGGSQPEDATVRMNTEDAEKTLRGTAGTGSTGSKLKKILPDVRSDIYSVGATLYHLLSGVRPARDAKDVVPLSPKEFSPMVVDIITKAMNPNPDLRYQTAAEMLEAFKRLHMDDPRVRRLKRQNQTAALLITILLAAGVFASFTGLKRIQTLDNWLKQVEYSKNALAAGDTQQAIEYALAAIPDRPGIFTPPAAAEAQKALTDALGVYELADKYQAHMTLELPSEPLKMTLSPGGTRLCAVYAYCAAVFDTETGAELAELPLEASVLSDAVFAGEDVLVFAGEDGIGAYDLQRREELWRGAPATQLAISADGRRVAALYKDETETAIYDTATGETLYTVYFDGRSQFVPVNDIFADAERDIFALNGDGTMLAASFSDGSLSIAALKDGVEIYDLLPAGSYGLFRGGFCGPYFAFSADGTENSLLFAVDTSTWTQTVGASALNRFLLQADETGVYVAQNNVLVSLDPATGEQTALASTDETITDFRCGAEYILAASGEQGYRFYDRGAELMDAVQTDTRCDFLAMGGAYAAIGSRSTPTLRLLRLDDHSAAEILHYDLTFDHEEARLSADGETLMLFRRDRFRLYGMDGGVLADVELPDSEHVYDQQYIRDESGSRLEVTYYDGMVRAWSAADGALLWERQGDAPDGMANEVFYTDHLRIEAPLHAAPVAYDAKTGREVTELEKDDHLIYVTQTGPYVVTEYVTALGERYGLLLNDRCETLAKLPYLCDTAGDTLLFDCPSGHLRASSIYDLAELCEMGRARLENTAEQAFRKR